jgi:tRNA1(Val) A37 N6-methylase TrmN6
MNDNSQNTKAVVTILGVLGGIALVVCSGVGFIGYTVVTRYNRAELVETEARQQAEAAQQAEILRERMPQ